MLVLVSTWRVRAVARRVLARRAVARRPERAGAAGAAPSWCAWNSLICSSSQARIAFALESLLPFEPGETLLQFRALGFERVDHLLNAGQVLLLLRRDLLGLGPETCCVRGTSTRAQGDVALAREVRKRGMCC